MARARPLNHNKRWRVCEPRFKSGARPRHSKKRKDESMQTQDMTHHYAEGKLATAIETQTARLPSDTFLWAAGGSILVSLALKVAGRDRDAHFVGQWAPTFLILGLYN